MLRLQRKANTQVISHLHNPHNSESTDTLHCLGEELPVAVCCSTVVAHFTKLNFFRELFGSSEETEELDNTENSENGEHIRRQERDHEALLTQRSRGDRQFA